MNGSRRDDGKISRLHPAFTFAENQEPVALVRIDCFVLAAMKLQTQPMALLNKNDFPDIMARVREPEFPTPRFENLFGFHVIF